MEKNSTNFLHSYTASILFYIGFIACFCFVLFKNKEFLHSLSFHNIHFFFIMLFITFVNVCSRGFINVFSFSLDEKRVTIFNGCKLATINTIGNYLPFSGGLIAKGIILKKNLGINYAQYAAISVYTFITLFVVSGIYGLFSTIVIQPDSYILESGFGAMLLVGLFIFMPIPKIPFLKRYSEIDRLQEIRKFFKSIVLKILLIHAIILLLLTCRLLCSFLIIDQDIRFIHVLLLTSGSVLTRFITLTPGAIGVREGIGAALAHLTGIDYQLAIVAIGIDRMAEIIIVFGTSGMIHLWEKLTSRKS
jgi:uncharacterized membrane protein YbhN (UPF0104 family)